MHIFIVAYISLLHIFNCPIRLLNNFGKNPKHPVAALENLWRHQVSVFTEPPSCAMRMND